MLFRYGSWLYQQNVQLCQKGPATAAVKCLCIEMVIRERFALLARGCKAEWVIYRPMMSVE